MKRSQVPTTLAFCSCLLLAACSGRIASTAGQECAEGLRIANQELEDAKVKGFGGSIQWVKAAGLLADAGVHRQLERFPSCTDKARRARIYIHEAQK
jgi:hypothetical protein